MRVLVYFHACHIFIYSERQRPERLISRLKSTGDDMSPKVVVIRQPRGPDGSKGFKQPRTAWAPPTA